MFVGQNDNNHPPCPIGYSSLGYTAETDSYLIREAVNRLRIFEKVLGGSVGRSSRCPLLRHPKNMIP